METLEVEIDKVTFTVFYDYTPGVGAPRCGNPSSDAYGTPPEPPEVEISKITIDIDSDILEMLRDEVIKQIEEAIINHEECERNIAA